MLDEMEKIRLNLVCLAQDEVLKKRCTKKQLQICSMILMGENLQENKGVDINDFLHF